MCSFCVGGTILSIQDIAEENSDSFLALTFNRRYSSYIYKRRSIGSNGLGWILPWWYDLTKYVR